MNSGSKINDSDLPGTPLPSLEGASWEDASLEDAEAVLTELAGVFFKSDPAPGQYPAGGRDPSLELEARYKTLLEQIPAVVFMAPLEAGFTSAYVSPHIEAVLGFSQDQWLNDPVRWYYQVHPDDRSRWSQEAATLFLSGQALRSVYRIIARDGHIVWFQCEAKMVRKPDGRPWFIHGVAFDISDIMRAEQALKLARDEMESRVRQRTAELATLNAELEKEIARRKRSQADLARQASALAHSNEDLEQFAYSASHDLQEPIRNLAVYSEWLSRDYRDQLDEKAQRHLKILTDSAERMSRLIRDLLEYTQVSSDFVETGNVADANQVMATVLQYLETAIRESGAVITSERLPKIDVSGVRLQQVLQNLVLNAIKYRSEEPPRVYISASRHESFWRFAVKDNGIGIAPEYHDQIFGIFKRLNHGGGKGGTGMGLAICKRIVERANGRIWVESKPGQGSTFLFTLPGAASEQAKQENQIL